MLGGSFRRIQFTPGPRARRPGRHAHLPAGHGPLRHRARPGVRQLPARRRDQPRAGEGAVGAARGHAGAAGDDRRRDLPACPRPFLVLATQNPIESEGTYPLPEAQIDRFLFKLLVDYPSAGRGGGGRRARRSAAAPSVRERVDVADLERYRAAAATVFVDREVDRLRRRARRRHPPPRALRPRRPGARSSSTARARAGRSASSAPPAPWRCCAVAGTSSCRRLRDLAADVLRHRLVLSYDALGDGVSADDILERILATVVRRPRRASRPWSRGGRAGGVSATPSGCARPRPPGPGADAARAARCHGAAARAALERAAARRPSRRRRRARDRAGAAAPVRGRRRRPPASTPRRARGRPCPTCASRSPSAR